MTRFVVDASVVLTWCFPDEHAPVARAIADMFKVGASAIAPAFWPHEILNALLVGEKRKRISPKLTESFLADLSTLPVELHHFPAMDVFGGMQRLSREHGLTAYEAAYLHLAQVAGLKLATLDDDLIKACKRSGVALL